MDSEQERLQHLGFFGIFKESFEIIFKNFKIFCYLWAFPIFPLTCVFLVVVPEPGYNLLLLLVRHEQLKGTQKGTVEYLAINESMKSAGASFAAYTIALFTVYLFGSALSTCAVVYATANIYRFKEAVTFKKFVGILRKIWKRLFLTFLIVFVIVFTINVVAMLLFFVIFVKLIPPIASLVLGIILLVIYLFSMVYIGFLGQLACVVSVLEDFKGFTAMTKAKALVKGKKRAAVFIFIVSSLLVSCLMAVLGIIFFSDLDLVELVQVCLITVGVTMLACVNLLGLVLPTVLYFVCKAYHRESVTVEDQ